MKSKHTKKARFHIESSTYKDNKTLQTMTLSIQGPLSLI
jgi:hypothetical protein